MHAPASLPASNTHGGRCLSLRSLNFAGLAMRASYYYSPARQMAQLRFTLQRLESVRDPRLASLPWFMKKQL